MKQSLAFIRIIYISLALCITIGISYQNNASGSLQASLITGAIYGSLLSSMLFALEWLFNRFNLFTWNITILGLFFGYLMGLVVTNIFNATVSLVPHFNQLEILASINSVIYLITCFLGMTFTARAAEEIHLSIPFIRFKPTTQQKKDILLDASILLDTRIIDLASSGLLNSHLIIPRFTLKELYVLCENADEQIRSKARRSLEVLKKLESIPDLNLRYSDSDFPEIKDSINKLIRLARLLDANIITADINRIQQSAIEGIVVINIHALSNALKPITQNGEFINIKIQRYGKEPRQGIGYLDDGTMVVVNGGAEFIGETIKSQVLSVKHTSSGRMIFCNATNFEEDFLNLTHHVANDLVEAVSNSHGLNGNGSKIASDTLTNPKSYYTL